MAWKHAKTTTQRGYGQAWRKLREVILRRDNYRCVECAKEGRYSRAREVDHIVEKSKGGTDNPENLQSLCVPCHAMKTNGSKHKFGCGADGLPLDPNNHWNRK